MSDPPFAPQQTQDQQQACRSWEIRTLRIRDLKYCMDKSYYYVSTRFAHTGEVLSLVICNKKTSQADGYGFIEFVTGGLTVESGLQTYGGTLMPNFEQNFWQIWASFSAGEKFTIFARHLAAGVTSYLLQKTFGVCCPTVMGAKAVIDRSYMFVMFGDESELFRAVNHLKRVFCSASPMHIGPATSKKTVTGQLQFVKGRQEAPSSSGAWN